MHGKFGCAGSPPKIYGDIMRVPQETSVLFDSNLSADPMTVELRRRSVDGAVVTACVQTTLFALNLATTAILARLLTPADFGLIAMVAAVSSFLLLFRDLGLSAATVQRDDLAESQINALFWINAALGLAMSALFAATAPLVARFYGQPPLRNLVIVWSCGFAVAGLGVQHVALLRRQMRFTALAVVDVASIAAGATTAIVSANLDAGYWALAYFQIVQQAVGVLGAWLASGWRPQWPPRLAGTRPLLSFGASYTGFGVLSYLSRNLDNVILGRVAGSAPLGLYTKAFSLLLLPVDRIRAPLAAVVVPALSRLQSDARRFRSYYLKAIASVVTFGMPLVVFLFVFAEDAILLVLGPQWRESVVLFRILAPAAFLETFNTVGSWACLPFGRTGRLLKWQVVATVVMVFAFVVGVRWGAVGMAVAFTVSTIAVRPFAILYLLRESPVRPIDLLHALARPASASVAAGLVLFAARGRFFPMMSGLMLFIVAVPLFVACYVLFLFSLPGGRQQIAELMLLLREFVFSPRKYSSAPAAR
jgi:O-antigen/teichoic acid export membrane protein